MQITKHKVWTYEDYCKLDDDKRYEILEGELIEMAAAPRTIHQIISSNLGYELIRYTRQKQLGRVMDAPVDIVFSEINVLQPDIVFISRERESIIQDKNVKGPPDLVVEILSPSNPSYDRKRKYAAYEKFKIKEYWIIDPVEQSIEIFTLENDKLISFCFVSNDKKVNSLIFPDLKISYDDLTI